MVPQSNEGFQEYYKRQTNELGQMLFQLAGTLTHAESANAGNTDTASLAQGYITVTVLNPDMTNHKKTDRLKEIFGSEITIDKK